MPDQSPNLPTRNFSRLEGLKRQSDQLASLSALLRERSERCGCDTHDAGKAKGVDKRSREQDREEVQEQLAKIISKLDEQKSHRSGEEETLGQ